jgi:hypothetical protein
MQTFYSVIKIAPNTNTDDSLSVGLLACDGIKYWLQFSEERKNGIKRLIEHNADAVEFAIKQLTVYVLKLNKALNKAEKEFFPLETLLNSEYFNYLNAYSNGLMRFSKPTILYDEINKLSFGKLFSLLIDKSVEKETISKDNSEKKFLSIVKTQLISKVSDKIHTEIKIDNKILPSMYFPFEMDCIGMNGALVGAKAIPFNKSFETIDKNISHYSYLISLLSSRYNKEIKKNNFFLIADEPKTINSPEHKTWENIFVNPLFKLINSEQLKSVTDVIESSKATRFLELV